MVTKKRYFLAWASFLITLLLFNYMDKTSFVFWEEFIETLLVSLFWIFNMVTYFRYKQKNKILIKEYSLWSVGMFLVSTILIYIEFKFVKNKPINPGIIVLGSLGMLTVMTGLNLILLKYKRK